MNFNCVSCRSYVAGKALRPHGYCLSLYCHAGYHHRPTRPLTNTVAAGNFYWNWLFGPWLLICAATDLHRRDVHHCRTGHRRATWDWIPSTPIVAVVGVSIGERLNFSGRYHLEPIPADQSIHGRCHNHHSDRRHLLYRKGPSPDLIGRRSLSSRQIMACRRRCFRCWLSRQLRHATFYRTRPPGDLEAQPIVETCST